MRQSAGSSRRPERATSDRPTGWGDPPVRPPAFDEMLAAAERIKGVAVRTPLLAWPDTVGLHLKPELLQASGSFKLRGVYNWAAGLGVVERAQGLSSFSAGNTALALGWCAPRLGVSCRSLLPDFVPPGKVAQLRAAGVEAVMLPFTQMADWLFRAGWRDEPWAFLHPWTEPALVAGHATVGLEILEDLPEVKTVFVPVGGGALAIGVAAAIKPRVPAARIVGVQTEACPALSKSISAGKPVWVERRPTVCEGVAVPFTTDQTFPALRAAVDAVVVVTEAEVRTGIALLYRRLGIKVEGAGALAFAAARRGFEPPAVAILSGGNIEPELFDSILAG